VDGRDYFFVEDAKFEAMVRANEFVEWVEVYKRRYGTGRAWMDSVLDTGMDVVLDIETTGALNLRRAIPDAVMIFIMPPSAGELEKRIRSRGKDAEDQIQLRMKYALHEVKLHHAYDFIIVNQELDLAYRQLESIIWATRLRRERMIPQAQAILQSFQGSEG
jgi:guanylate kinase